MAHGRWSHVSCEMLKKPEASAAPQKAAAFELNHVSGDSQLLQFSHAVGQGQTKSCFIVH